MKCQFKRQGKGQGVKIKNPEPLFLKRVIPGYIKIFGGDLLSHTVSHAVPSALKSLTSVFEMGTGVTSLLSPPKKVFGVDCFESGAT